MRNFLRKLFPKETVIGSKIPDDKHDVNIEMSGEAGVSLKRKHYPVMKDDFREEVFYHITDNQIAEIERLADMPYDDIELIYKNGATNYRKQDKPADVVIYDLTYGRHIAMPF